MNIPFTLPDSKLDGEFLKGAEARGMVQLKGHRAVGGMRASICIRRCGVNRRAFQLLLQHPDQLASIWESRGIPRANIERTRRSGDRKA
jgi:hypothetical protein